MITEIVYFIYPVADISLWGKFYEDK